MYDPITNLAVSTVATAPSPATSGTTIVIATGHGSRFPDPSTDGAFNLIISPASGMPDPSNTEIVRCTARSSDTLTVTRAQEGTTARTIVTGDYVKLGVTKKTITDLSDRIHIGASAPATPSDGDLWYDSDDTSYDDGNSFVYNETPSGTVNSSNTVFDTANNYIAGTIQVYRDGQLMKGGGDDYTETDSNTITFTTAPTTGSVLLVHYQQAVSVSGNADTLDGSHLSEIFPTGIGAWTSFTPSLTNVTIGNGTLTGYYCQIGKTVFMRILLRFGSTTSITGSYIQIGTPSTAATYSSATAGIIGQVKMLDGGTGVYLGAYGSQGNVWAFGAASSYTNIVDVTASIPHTWAVNDEILISAAYEVA